MSELKEELAKRFAKGIHKSFSPCPLIGPKWLQEFPEGNPADFRFFGISKLTKAIGWSSERILKVVMRNVSLAGLDVDVEISQGVLIDINRKGKNKGDKKHAAGKAKAGPKPKPQSARTKKPKPKPRPAGGNR
jgi:hypothetical protein